MLRIARPVRRYEVLTWLASTAKPPVKPDREIRSRFRPRFSCAVARETVIKGAGFEADQIRAPNRSARCARPTGWGGNCDPRRGSSATVSHRMPTGFEDSLPQPANCTSRSERSAYDRRPLATATPNCDPGRQLPPERGWPTRPPCIGESTLPGAAVQPRCFANQGGTPVRASSNASTMPLEHPYRPGWAPARHKSSRLAPALPGV